MKEEINWKEIKEDKATEKMVEGLSEQAERFIDNVHNKKFGFIDKLKVGAGRKIIKMAFKKFSDEYFENAIVSKGLKKMGECLDKGQKVEFNKYYLKKENDKFFISFRTKQ